jgi:hypothetical protein
MKKKTTPAKKKSGTTTKHAAHQRQQARARESQAATAPKASGKDKPDLKVEKGGKNAPAEQPAEKEIKTPEDVTAALKGKAMSATTKQNLLKMYEDGLDAEDDAIVNLAEQIRRNVRMELLLESEGVKVPDRAK